MAVEKIKWHRPNDDAKFRIESRIKDLLSYHVLFSCSKYSAMEKLFPEYNDTRGSITAKGKQTADQIFDHPENKKYIKAMRQTLSDISGGLYKPDSEEKSNLSEISEGTKRATITRLLNQLVKLIGEGNLTGEDIKTYSEIMKKVGWLKEEEDAQEAPRRYCPVTCKQCDYKIFVEEQMELGNIKEID